MRTSVQHAVLKLNKYFLYFLVVHLYYYVSCHCMIQLVQKAIRHMMYRQSLVMVIYHDMMTSQLTAMWYDHYVGVPLDYAVEPKIERGEENDYSKSQLIFFMHKVFSYSKLKA